MIKVAKSIKTITVPTPFPVGDVNMYLIIGDTLTLVDAGVKTKAAWQAVKNQLNSFGYGPEDIEQLILTHHHPDHIGLVDQFPNIKAIYGHKKNRPWLEREESYFNYYENYFADFYYLCGTPKSYSSFLKTLRGPLEFIGTSFLLQEIEDKMRLPGHPEFLVVSSPGHAGSHLAFLHEKEGLLIGGDLLLEKTSSNPILEPPNIGETERPKPLLLYRESLEKMLSYEINEVLPGHGTKYQTVTELIKKRLLKQEQRAQKVFEFLKTNSQTPFQLCQKLFPTQKENQLGLTMSETIGQLDYLENEGYVKLNQKDNGHFIYSTID